MMTKKVNIVENVTKTMNEAYKEVSQLTPQVKEIEMKNGDIVQSKQYTFLNPHGKRVSLKTFDSEIIECTEKIAYALKLQEKSTFIICKELAKLNDKTILNSIGFNTIAEYAYCVFDFQKTTAQQYARIGEIFIDDNYNIIDSLLPSGLQKGHLIELLTLVKEDNSIEEIEKLYAKSYLTDGMSTAIMRKKIKEYKKNASAIEGEAKEVTEKADNTKTNESVQTVDNKGNQITTEKAIEIQKVNFEKQASCARVITLCNELLSEFNIMSSNGIDTTPTNEQITAIKNFIAELLK